MKNTAMTLLLLLIATMVFDVINQVEEVTVVDVKYIEYAPPLLIAFMLLNEMSHLEEFKVIVLMKYSEYAAYGELPVLVVFMVLYEMSHLEEFTVEAVTNKTPNAVLL